MSEVITLYQDAIEAVKQSSPLRREEKTTPEHYIVATHGPALTKAVKEDPNILDNIGIYRVNCSHIGKEPDLAILAEYLRTIREYVPILIDLQGPKPRIHETMPGEGGMLVELGDELEVEYAPADSEERFCTPGKLKVCFQEIVEVMHVDDVVIFDDGKMSAIVREVGKRNIIECSEILNGDKTFILGGRKGICVRNRPLGIDCITDHDRKSIEFARDILGFEYVDNVMVSYFSTPEDVLHFVKIMREEYKYAGNLGGKFETPYAVYNIDKILELNHLTLAMFGRGDLRVEMDPRAVSNMHDIQVHFFTACRKHHVESICATGFLESMLTPEGKVTPEEIYDMETSMKTHPHHLMLSGESTYGAQAADCIKLEASYQRITYEELEKKETKYRTTPKVSLRELLYIGIPTVS